MILALEERRSLSTVGLRLWTSANAATMHRRTRTVPGRAAGLDGGDGRDRFYGCAWGRMQSPAFVHVRIGGRGPKAWRHHDQSQIDDDIADRLGAANQQIASSRFVEWLRVVSDRA